MADIFGKNVTDYQHLNRAKKAGMLDAHLSALKRMGREHNFNALTDARNPRLMPFNDLEANAQAIGYLTNNLQAIQAAVEETLYLDFRLNELVPIVTNVPEGATTYAYKVLDRFGKGKFIDSSGHNANNAGVSMRLVPYSLAYGGIIPEWTIEDIRRCAFGGIALDTESIKSATEGCMNHIEEVGLSGDSDYGFTGLINNASIPTTPAGKLFTAMTDLEMAAFITTNVSKIIQDTNEIFGRVVKTGMTIYLPIKQYDIITTKTLGTNVDKTVWEFVRMQNPWTYRTGNPLELRSVAELAAAGAASADRALFGFNDPKVMEMAMPISPRVLKTLETMYGAAAPMEYKISGLNVKHPKACLYVDGI